MYGAMIESFVHLLFLLLCYMYYTKSRVSSSDNGHPATEVHSLHDSGGPRERPEPGGHSAGLLDVVD